MNTTNYTVSGVVKAACERSRGSISLVIVALCVSVFLAVAILGIFHVVSRQTAIQFLGLSYTGVFQRHLYYQFLSAPLFHANVWHLLFNMLSVWLLGPDIERILGRRRYVIFSVLCAASSMIGSLIVTWGTGSITMGYSGVIFGILVAQAMYFPDTRIAVFAFFPMKMKFAAILLAAVELYLTLVPDGGGVAHAAHLSGALVAFVFLRWFCGKRVSDSQVRIGPRPKVVLQSVRRTVIKHAIPREL